MNALSLPTRTLLCVRKYTQSTQRHELWGGRGWGVGGSGGVGWRQTGEKCHGVGVGGEG